MAVPPLGQVGVRVVNLATDDSNRETTSASVSAFPAGDMARFISGFDSGLQEYQE